MATIRPISVFHTDQPGNDFSTLFQVVHTNPASYLRDQPNVFTFATGKSFYEPLFPPNTITLGWSSYALMWPSQLAALIPGHVFSTRSSGAVLAAFNKRGSQRLATLPASSSDGASDRRPLGDCSAARDDDGLNELEPLMDHANAVLLDFVTNRTISAAERTDRQCRPIQKVCRTFWRHFAGKSRFHGLAMEHCEVFPGPDPVWDDYQRHHDRQQVAVNRPVFFRAAFRANIGKCLGSQSHRRRPSRLH